MQHARYIQRRGEIKRYFNGTALDRWKKLATDEPLNRIRETVRAGRDQMRDLLLSYLPEDLSGWRILDAGCGAGAMSVELAGRGADVIGIDLSPEMIRFAEAAVERLSLPGSVHFEAGDMLSPAFGRFDAVVAMDSLIHYKFDDTVAAFSTLAERTDRKIVATFAPRTIPLTVMHAVGRLFPQSDRAPSIQPTAKLRLERHLMLQAAFSGWNVGRSECVKSGFYTSQAIEVIRQ